MRTVRMGCRKREAASVLEPEQDACAAGFAAGEDGGQQPHGVRAGRVARGLDVGVFVEVDAGTDRNPVRQILAAAGTRTPISDSQLVRTRLPSWSLSAGSEPFSFRRKSRSMRAQRGGREDHAAAGEAAASGGDGRGANRAHFVAFASVGIAIQRADIHHAGFGEYPRAVLLGQVEVVLVEGVLGVDTGSPSCSRRSRCRWRARVRRRRNTGRDKSCRQRRPPALRRRRPWCDRRSSPPRALAPRTGGFGPPDPECGFRRRPACARRCRSAAASRLSSPPGPPTNRCPRWRLSGPARYWRR